MPLDTNKIRAYNHEHSQPTTAGEHQMLTNTPSASIAALALSEVLETLKGVDLATAGAETLVPLVKAVQSVAAFTAALDAEIQRRAIANGEMLPGVVVKDAVTHRKWHDQQAAEELAFEQFGEKAFTRSLLSPAGMEKLGADGKAFVAVASYKPEAGKRCVY